MKKNVLKIYIFSFILILCIPMYSQNENLNNLLPADPKGWISLVPPKKYTAETLYEYINGGAELYISYGMQSVISKHYTKDGFGEIRVEIFDMSKSENAFGVFTHTRTKNEQIFGQGSQYFTGAQIFWKGRYFISIIADDENEEIKTTIAELSKEIDKRISENGPIPEIIRLLPTENRVKDGYIYFHHYIWLNSFYFLSNENIFQIDQKSHAAISKYKVDDTTLYLLIIQFENRIKAEKAGLTFREEFMDNQTKDPIIQIEDNSWLSGKIYENYFVGVFNSKTKESAGYLIDRTINNLKSK